MFRGFDRDSLLLAVLAYNVGCGKVMKSRMYVKMQSGNRNIYRDYVDVNRWNVFGKPNEQSEVYFDYAMVRKRRMKYNGKIVKG